MDPIEAARYFYQAGFRGQALITMVAVAVGESGLNPGARGDTSITNRTWGPSIGLAQIRSLNAQSGTGQTRDATRLADPAFNAAAAFEISGGGRNFRPWTVFTSGKYRNHLGQAQAAVAQMNASGQVVPTGGAAPNGTYAGGQSLAGMDFLAQYGQAPIDPAQPVINAMDALMTVLVGGTRTGGGLGMGSSAMEMMGGGSGQYGSMEHYGGGGASAGAAAAGGGAGQLPADVSATPPNPAAPRYPGPSAPSSVPMPAMPPPAPARPRSRIGPPPGRNVPR